MWVFVRFPLTPHLKASARTFESYLLLTLFVREV
jgi:hypothetical protein